MTLSKEAFAKQIPLPQKEVFLPELGGTVIIRGFTAKQRSEHENSFIVNGRPNARRQLQRREKLIAQTACDEQGNLIFDDGDLDMIGRLPAVVIEPLFDAALEVCGMGVNVDSAAKNSEETQTAS
jgi:hypothetical protein